MRAMRIFLGFATSSALAGAVAAGCGSSSSPSTPVDSGTMQDVTMEAMPQMEAAPPEAGPDVVEAATSDACVPDATIGSLPIPDAAIGDSGATAASCLTCFESDCMNIVTQCNQSCACISAYESFETCIAAGLQTPVACAFSAFSNVPGISITMLSCALGCATPCGQMLPVPDGGMDSGSGDGGAEAGAD